MNGNGAVRFSTLLHAASAEERESLRERLQANGLSDGDFLEQLIDPSEIRRRAATLSEGDMAAFLQLLDADPDTLIADFLSDDVVGRLVELGLATYHGVDDDASMVLIPFEVRVAIFEQAPSANADVAVFLAFHEEPDRENLADLLDVDLSESEDELDSALMLAEALTDPDAIRSVIDSLNPFSRATLYWLCEQDGAVARQEIEAFAADLSLHHEDAVHQNERVLERIGLVYSVDGYERDLVLVPPDLREAMSPVFETELEVRALEAYQYIRDSALPAVRDVFPRGVGADCQLAARLRALAADDRSGETPFDGLLEHFELVSAEGGVGEHGPAHLDAGGPDAFARLLLRFWLADWDDPYTRRVIGAFGGDLDPIAEYLRGTDDDGDRGGTTYELEVFTQLTIQLRGHLVFLLSVLPAGYWYRLDRLTEWYVAVYRLALWFHGHYAVYRPEFPREALPVSATLITPGTATRVREAISAVVEELLEPLGAVATDASGELLAVNPESLRVFRDGDWGLNALWDAAERYLGDDINNWLPLPTDTGIRLAGVAELSWEDDLSLSVSRDAHFADLQRLEQWSHLRFSGDHVHFRFGADSIDAAIRAGHDPDVFLSWLWIRTGGPLPSQLRALFPLESAVSDRGADAVHRDVTVRVSRLVDTLESWGERPLLRIAEEIRGWGAPAVPVVLERADALIEERQWKDPQLRHLALLLGELGDAAAAPSLLRIIGFCDDPLLEGAAAMAAARLGGAVVSGLLTLVENARADTDKRLAAAGTLGTIAVVHPHLCDTIVRRLLALVDDEDADPDLLSVLGLVIAETGHPDAEGLLYQLRDEGAWVDTYAPFDEAIWLATISPAVWGHPIFAAPLAQLFASPAESERLAREAGIDEMLEGSGYSRDLLLGVTSFRRPVRRGGRRDPESGDEGGGE